MPEKPLEDQRVWRVGDQVVCVLDRTDQEVLSIVVAVNGTAGYCRTRRLYTTSRVERDASRIRHSAMIHLLDPALLGIPLCTPIEIAAGLLMNLNTGFLSTEMMQDYHAIGEWLLSQHTAPAQEAPAPEPVVTDEDWVYRAAQHNIRITALKTEVCCGPWHIACPYFTEDNLLAAYAAADPYNRPAQALAAIAKALNLPRREE